MNVTEWQSWPGFDLQSTLAPTPANYTLLFANLQGAIQSSAYLGYSLLTSYDVDACATSCTSQNGCVAFNIYFERDPALNGDGCTLAGTDADETITNVYCSLWGGDSTYSSANATNTGQWAVDGTFEVSITGKLDYSSSIIAEINI